MKLNTLLKVLAGGGILVAGTGNAFAYLDPGSGSAIVQVILGGLAGVAVAFKLFWQRIKLFFSFQWLRFRGRPGKSNREQHRGSSRE